MAEKRPFARLRRWQGYALGILIESAYVISLSLVAAVLVWLISRWF